MSTTDVGPSRWGEQDENRQRSILEPAWRDRTRGDRSQVFVRVISLAVASRGRSMMSRMARDPW